MKSLGEDVRIGSVLFLVCAAVYEANDRTSGSETPCRDVKQVGSGPSTLFKWLKFVLW